MKKAFLQIPALSRPGSFSLGLCLLFTCLIYLPDCKKSGGNNSGGYKIALVSGGGQTDTTGNILAAPVVFKLTYNGDTLSYGYIRLETYIGDSVPQIVEYSVGKTRNSYPYYFDFQYLVNFKWKLNSTVGAQHLTAVLLDSLHVPRDSVTVTATGTKPVKGWNASGDIPLTTNCVAFCQLPSGRVLTVLRTADYPYYSDDEGSSWHALKTFPGQFKITNIYATPQNEVFAWVPNQALYYSADGGQTWGTRINGLPASQIYGGVLYDPIGSLFAPTLSGEYVSLDKGLNWQILLTGVYGYPISVVNSFSDSTILAVTDNDWIQSTDKGATFQPFSGTGIGYLSSLYIDSSDNIYAGSYGSGYNNDGLYVSKDHGQHWTDVYHATLVAGFNLSITQITGRNGWIYFYSGSTNNLVKTNDLVHFTPVDPPVPSDNGRESYAYFVTRDSHLIVSTEFYGLYFYIP